MYEIVITIFSRGEGRKHNRGIPWVAVYDNQEIATAPAGVCFKACRVLLERGINPDTIVKFHHKGSKTSIFEPMTVGQAAGLMVLEGDRRLPRIVPYVPMDMSADADVNEHE